MKFSSRIFFGLVVATLLLACSRKKASDEQELTPGSTEPSPTEPVSGGDPVATAKQIFSQRCAVCHGATGLGDGVASASLNPKPRMYADPEWQASVTDEYIEKIIKFGGAGVGKSPAMPNNPDIKDPAVVVALRDIVRSFNKKK